MRAKYFIRLAPIIVLQALIIFLLFYLRPPSPWASIINASAFFLPLITYYLVLYYAPAFVNWSRARRFIIFAPSSLVGAIIGYCLFNLFWFDMSFGGWPWEHHLPSQERVQQQFENHKTDYTRLVTLLQKDPSLANGDPSSPMAGEYKTLIHKTGIKFVTVREDGSIELALAGYGSTISSDAFVGMRYLPKDHKAQTQSAGMPLTVVSSLDSSKLPQWNGEVATGLYVIPLESEWSIYRLEIQE